jgi:secreted PhoX family phosphatase
VNPRTRELERDFAILSGTVRNCAGGATPWGSWISCEETVAGKLHFFDRGEGVRYGSFEREHGYCFEVPAFSDVPAPPKPLKAMGRFVHEAVAVDPHTDIVYETEDRNPSGFYRFLPHQRKKLEAGGRLQMLKVAWKDNYDTRIRQAIGSKIRCTWVDIAKPDPANAGEDDAAIYKQGFAKGGATFNRLEGCFFANGHIFMSATQGGNRNLGQVWRYTPEGDDEGVLVLLFESYDPEILNMPDNICLSKRGGLVICEDNNNNRPNFVRGLTPEGKVFDFAKNIALGKDMTEFSGVTFSPDGETLFLNMFGLGVTCAIWGDWKAGCL